MRAILTWDEALTFFKQGETILSSSFGGPITFYTWHQGMILMRNDHLKATISLEEMEKAFHAGKFYVYETKKQEIEIDQNDRYWRQ